MPVIYGVTTVGGGGGTGGGGNAPGVELKGITQADSEINLTISGNGIEDAANMLVVPPNISSTLNIKIIAETDATPKKAASWEVFGLVKRSADPSTLEIVGFSPVFAMSDPELSSLNISLSENSYYGGISIKCKGIPQYTVIKWVATVTLTEV